MPAGLKVGETRSAIVMAHGFTGVREMSPDKCAARFAREGFVILVFDYRCFGGGGGAPRSRVLRPDQVVDYRNAISWASLQADVDPDRIGVSGTSMSGGHVIHLAAFDRRIKAVAAQGPLTNVRSTDIATWPAEQQAGFPGWLAAARTERAKTGKPAEIPVAAPADKPSFRPLQAWYDALVELSKPAPSGRNRLVVESPDTHILHEPVTNLARGSPTLLMMIVASDDVITPTADARKRLSSRRASRSGSWSFRDGASTPTTDPDTTSSRVRQPTGSSSGRSPDLPAGADP